MAEIYIRDTPTVYATFGICPTAAQFQGIEVAAARQSQTIGRKIYFLFFLWPLHCK